MIYTLTLNPALDLELTVPEITLDTVLRADSVQTDYGGKGFNVSRALLAIGVKSIALGFIGGSVGAQLSSGLAELGIPTDFVPVKGETRTNISVVAANHSHYAKVNEPGPFITADESAALLEKIRSLVKPSDWWVIAGSLPPGIQPQMIAEIIQLVQASGAYVALDVDGIALRLGCIAGACLIKPNAVEASELIGARINTLNDAIQALGPIHQLGAQRVSISLGKAGAVYSDGKRSWFAVPPSIHERNPIGAGDAMVAGLVRGLLLDMTGDEVLRWAVACGAAAASLDGTAIGSLPLVQSLVEQINVVETGYLH